MRTPLLVVFFFFIISLLSAQRSVRGSGNVVTQDRDVEKTFTEIDASNAIKVIVERGDQHSIRVEADDNLIDHIETEVYGNALHARIKPNQNYRQTTKMIVYVTMPELERIEASGAALVTTMSEFSGDELRVEASGAAGVRVEFNGNRVVADADGAGSVEIRGSVEYANLDASSAASINAKELSAKNVEADAHSAASIKVTATESLDAKANSAAVIRYYGDPKKIYTDSNSAGSIKG